MISFLEFLNLLNEDISQFNYGQVNSYFLKDLKSGLNDGVEISDRINVNTININLIEKLSNIKVTCFPLMGLDQNRAAFGDFLSATGKPKNEGFARNLFYIKTPGEVIEELKRFIPNEEKLKVLVNEALSWPFGKKPEYNEPQPTSPSQHKVDRIKKIEQVINNITIQKVKPIIMPPGTSSTKPRFFEKEGSHVIELNSHEIVALKNLSGFYFCAKQDVVEKS